MSAKDVEFYADVMRQVQAIHVGAAEVAAISLLRSTVRTELLDDARRVQELRDVLAALDIVNGETMTSLQKTIDDIKGGR